ncbi:MAG TPA: HEAT repeat domain-containing protein, partial [Phototrophicaceae bacterium]|nr:HEAT repeat domain-containing protein [Phototrophicaceae bacterium]
MTVHQLQSVQVPAASLPVWEGSPFPGLRAFTDQQAEIFFGRGREIDALVEMVRQLRFVAVVSASGAGKSSLVAAGLIPRLRANAIDTENSREWRLPHYVEDQWLGIRCTPGEMGDNPFQALAAKLAPIAGMKIPELTTLLSQNPTSLDDLLKDQPQTLFFIDQFEELFTTVQPGLIQRFIELLDHLAKSAYARVVITLRGDFYHRCLDYPELATLLQGGTFPLAAPTRSALRDMIASPADRAEIRFENRLIDQILDDTGKEPGALALLAYTLDELYQIASDRSDRNITFGDYQAIGGVQGAIGKRAELVFGKLPEEVQKLLPKVFQELVSVNEEGTPTRKRAELNKVTQSSEAQQLVNSFIEARLLVSEQTTLEVAHEALFRAWSQLVDWIQACKEDLHLLGQVKRAAAEWNSNNRHKDYLWTHERLAPVYQMLERLHPHLDEIATTFIQPEIDRLMKEYYAEEMPEHRRQSIIDRLVEIGDDAVPAFLDAFVNIRERKKDDPLRKMIFSKLSLFPHIVHNFLWFLKVGNLKQRYSAIEALEEIKNQIAVPPLIEALRDPDVCVSAARALGTLLATLGDVTAI